MTVNYSGTQYLMKSLEIINEYSFTSRRLIDKITDSGYKLLGRGVDQAAFEKPDDPYVLKLFGTHRGHGTDQVAYFTSDQKMFFYWADYCHRNRANKTLPIFGKYKKILWEDDTYVAIFQERLFNIPDERVTFLHQMIANVAESDDTTEEYREDFSSYLYGLYHDDRREPDEFELQQINTIHKNIREIGRNTVNQLYLTLRELSNIGRQKGWIFDMHPGNFMQRKDGSPVIVDPWTI